MATICLAFMGALWDSCMGAGTSVVWGGGATAILLIIALVVPIILWVLSWLVLLFVCFMYFMIWWVEPPFGFVLWWMIRWGIVGFIFYIIALVILFVIICILIFVAMCLGSCCWNTCIEMGAWEHGALAGCDQNPIVDNPNRLSAIRFIVTDLSYDHKPQVDEEPRENLHV